MTQLLRIHDGIDARVRAIREAVPDWLCAKGCGNCCRRLADLPQLTAAEWDLLQEGLAALPPDKLEEIGQAIAVLGERPVRPVTCPLLDQASNACPVYAQRPVACRTYGFYVQRDRGLYCHEIEAQVADGSLAAVVWGNHDAIDQGLGALSEARALNEWFVPWFERWRAKHIREDV